MRYGSSGELVGSGTAGVGRRRSEAPFPVSDLLLKLMISLEVKHVIKVKGNSWGGLNSLIVSVARRVVVFRAISKSGRQ
jgi:hypothetical protein